jgi:hypothetical protein
MSLENPNGIESSVSKNTKLRRTFLKRASATAVVGAIPAKSVWANGITNSIVASGHGSDFAHGVPIELLSPCSILAVLSENSNAGLDLNFSQVFGEGPDQTFSEILSCHCDCPVPDEPTTTLLNAISNVSFRVKLSDGSYKQFKIDAYDVEYPGDAEVKDPLQPKGYFAYVERECGGTVEDYVIKAGNAYFNSSGTQVLPTYNGWFVDQNQATASVNADHDEYDSTTSTTSTTAGDSDCESDETIAMVTIYLNARFDLHFRESTGTSTENWPGSNGIYYPILSSTAAEGNLVNSIKSSKNQLIDILTQYNAIDPPPSCP